MNNFNLSEKKTALIGYGYWGKKVYNTLSKIINKENIFVVDPNINQTKQKIKFSTLNFILSDKTIRHVLIVTPEETHFKIAKKCLLNKKNIFVEKPLCLRKNQAVKLHSLANKNGLSIYVDYTFLYDPYINKIKEIIDGGEIGRLASIESTRNSVNINKPNISVFDDLATHDIYLGKYFFGNYPIRISIEKKSQPGQASATYDFNNGKYIAHYSWIKQTAKRTMIIKCTDGTITWDKNNKFLRVQKEDKKPKMISVTMTIYPLEKSILSFYSDKLNYNYTKDVEILEQLNKK